MTRVIGGSAGGRRLRTPPGSGTRPTSDRVREALFSALEAELGSWTGVRVLDLYAGSGAIGLEAASRGAARVVLVESDRRAADVVRHNVRELGLGGVCTVLSRPVEKALADPLQDSSAPVDLVYVDPPYSLGLADLRTVLYLLDHHGWLSAHAVVVLERSARDAEPDWPDGWVRERSKVYGETVLWWLSLAPAAS